MSPTTLETDTWHSTAGRIRAILGEIARKNATCKDRVLQIVLMLDELEMLYRSQPARRAKPGRPPSPGVRYYRRQWKAGDEFLAEYRAGRSQPFLVPQEVYDAAACVMAQARSPISFNDWHEAVNRRLDRELSDYQCRAILRFWLAAKPSLVKKMRTRYQPTSRTDFPTAARRAFEQLPLA